MQTPYSKPLAVILAIFLGGLGIHKFYTGRYFAGFVYLIFCWTIIPTLFSIFDAIALACTPEEQCLRK